MSARRLVACLVALGLSTVPLPGAQVTPQRLRAGGLARASLKVGSFGRVSLATRSPAGARLRVVDRMLGALGETGRAGEEDGRLDLFLEQGEYRLEVETPPGTSGQVELVVREFQELSPSPWPTLAENQLVETTLEDFQQRSYWLYVPPGAPPVPIQVAGRAASHVHLWRAGEASAAATEEAEATELASGQPLRVMRLAPALQSGWYQLTVYGGTPLSWSSEQQSFPLFIQVGVPYLTPYLRHQLPASPFGCSFFRTSGDQTLFRLELPTAATASLQVGRYRPEAPLSPGQHRVSLDKTARVPAVELVTLGEEEGQSIAVCTEHPTPFVLQTGRHQLAMTATSSSYWLFLAPLGDPRDVPPVTALVTSAKDDALVAAQAVSLDQQTSWHRTFNLLQPVSLFLQVRERLSLRVEVEGVEGTATVAPWTTASPLRSKSAHWPASFSLEAGLYRLTLSPRTPGRAQVTLKGGSLLEGLAASLKLAPVLPEGGTVLVASAPWAQLTLTDLRWGSTYALKEPELGEARLIASWQSLPWTTRQPLPLILAPGESRRFPVAVIESVTLQARTSSGQLLPLNAEQGPPQEKLALPMRDGVSWVTVTNTTTQHAWVVIEREPAPLLATSVSVPSADEMARSRPPTLPLAQTVVAPARQLYRLEISRPGLYRIESLGPWAAAAVLRTRSGELARSEADGLGDNFLIQRYLREGLYELAVENRSSYSGLPVLLQRATLVEGGQLWEGIWRRLTLPADQAVRLALPVKKPGTYGVTARRLGGLVRCRLEDEQGFPVGQPDAPCNFQANLTPGRYRLLLLPEGQERRVKVAVRERETERALVGHGPHPLELGTAVRHVWHEPQDGEPRVPDLFRFSLPAPARVHIRLSEGMEGSLRLLQDPSRPPIRVSADQCTCDQLPAGTWELALTSSTVNNQLPYTLRVETEELVAGSSRTLTSGRLTLSVGESPITELYSDGEVDVRALVFDASGKLLASNDDGPDSWDFYLALPLPPGRYTLQVERVGEQWGETRVVMASRQEERLPPWVPQGPHELALSSQLVRIPLDVPAGADFLFLQGESTHALGLALVGSEGQILAFSQGRQPMLAGRVAAGAPLALLVFSLNQEPAHAKLTAFAGPLPPTTLAPMSPWALTSLAGTGWFAGRLALPGGALVSLRGHRLFSVTGTAGAPKPVGEELLAASGQELLLLSQEPAVSVEPAVLTPKNPLRFSLREGGPVPVQVTGAGGPALVLARAFPEPVGVSLGEKPRENPWTVDGLTSAGFAATAQRAWCWRARGEQEVSVELSLVPLPPPREAPLMAGQLSYVLPPGEGVRVSLPPAPQLLRLLLGQHTVALVEGSKGSILSVAAEQPRAEEQTAVGSHVTFWSLGDGGPVGLRVATQKESGWLTQLLGLLFPGASGERPALTEGFWHLPATGGGWLRWALAPFPTARRLSVWQAAAPPLLLLPTGEVREGPVLEVPPSGGELLLLQGEEPLALWLSTGVAGKKPEARETLTLPAQIPLAGERAVRLAAGEWRALNVTARSPVSVRLWSEGQASVEQVLPFGGSWVAPLGPGEAVLALRCLVASCQPVELWSTPAPLLKEGVNPPLLVAPGETRFFQLRLAARRELGIGVRCQPDLCQVLLRSPSGETLGQGPVLMRELLEGSHLLSVTAPAEGEPMWAAVVVLGLTNPPTSPPEELVRCYPQLALGLVPSCPPPPAPPQALPRLPWEQEESQQEPSWSEGDEDESVEEDEEGEP